MSHIILVMSYNMTHITYVGLSVNIPWSNFRLFQVSIAVLHLQQFQHHLCLLLHICRMVISESKKKPLQSHLSRIIWSNGRERRSDIIESVLNKTVNLIIHSYNWNANEKLIYFRSGHIIFAIPFKINVQIADNETFKVSTTGFNRGFKGS